jgi:hypothetical protein
VAEGLAARHIAVTVAASQIGNPCLPSFHLRCSAPCAPSSCCDGMRAASPTAGSAHTRKGGAARHEDLGLLLFSCGCPGGLRDRDPGDSPDNSVIKIKNGCDGNSIAAALHYTDTGKGEQEAGQFVESVLLTCNGQST